MFASETNHKRAFACRGVAEAHLTQVRLYTNFQRINTYLKYQQLALKYN